MYYQKLFELNKEHINKDKIREIDKWLFNLSNRNADRITILNFSVDFELDFSIANFILEKCCDYNILAKVYALKCPECGYLNKFLNSDEVLKNIVKEFTCINCEYTEESLTDDDILIIYKKINIGNHNNRQS